MSSSELTDDLKKEDIAIFQKPMRMAFMLRKKIMKQRLGYKLRGRMLSTKTRGEEITIMGFIDQYTTTFLQLEDLGQTEFPFPIGSNVTNNPLFLVNRPTNETS